MNRGNIADLSAQLDSMIGKLGIEKLAAEGPIGESAGIIADPGTSQPAKQESDRSEIQPATEGAQSASNNSMLKEEVPGDNTAVANPSDADNSGAASSTENVTTATFTGEKKDEFGSRQQTLDAPGTSHPADVNKDPEKYSSDLRASASLIDQEIEKISAVTTEQDATVGDRIGELLLGKEASAEEKDAVVLSSVEQYLSGYAKTASLIGEMTSDALDILSKQAMGEEGMPMDPAMGGEGMPMDPAMAEGDGVPAEALEAGAAEGELAGGEEAAALAEAAAMVAAELGVEPEVVLEAAIQELAAGGGEMGGMPEEGAPAEMDEEAAAMGAEADLGGEEEAAKMAAVNEELAELRKQAAELKQIKEAQAKAEGDSHLQSLVASAVRAELESLSSTPSA